MDYYQAGFDGYLDGLTDRQVCDRHGINIYNKAHSAEIIRGWIAARDMDRSTTPSRSLIASYAG
ncbi:hypothetical protein ACRQ5Q_14805 [Bradyrhizobium sp. PMVTL-01]|uniref:hypothetical protein n=1 Tax=Bradyrhizobium sp. PMVTL-01 TaxID=3434999 RepID=UPI003F6FFB1A